MDMAKIVGEAVTASLEPLKREMLAAASETAVAKVTEVGKDITEIRAKLAELAEGNETRPDAEKVVDLEKRLVDAETIIAEMRANPSLPSNADKPAEVKGMFITDLTKAREFVRMVGGNSQSNMSKDHARALDSGLFSTGGQVSAETADQFIDFLIAEQTTLNRINVRRMMGPTGYTDELTIAKRKMRKATEATAPTACCVW